MRVFITLTAYARNPKKENERMADGLKRVEDMMGWEPKETIEKFHEWWAEANKDSFDQYKGDFSNVDDEEETEYLLNGFEATYARRNTSSGSGKTYVGMVLGYNGKTDLMGRQREKALDQLKYQGIDWVLKNGVQPYNDDRVVPIGRGAYHEGAWKVFDSNDREVHTGEGAENEIPNWAIAVPGEKYYLALLGGPRGPKPAFSYKTEWWGIFAEKGDFQQKGFGSGTPIILECSFDAADIELKLNTPVSFQAEEDVSWFDKTTPILKANNLNPTYGLGWLPDEMQEAAAEVFDPAQMIVQYANFVSNLEDVHDYHDDNKTQLNSGRFIGPTFAIRGTADYMDHAGRDEKIYGLSAEGGAQHRMSVFSQAIRREDASAAIYLSVSRKLIDDHHAFQVKKNGEWHDYTAGTQLFAIIRTRTWENNTTGEEMLDADVLNIYAVPNRSLVAATVPEDTNDLGSLGGFRSD